MPKVKILIKGYLSQESGGRTCPTVVLVQDNNLNIICDPGTTRDPNLIISALKKEKLYPEDIDIVFLTHSHYDHFKNITIFKKAKCLDYWALWDNDTAAGRPVNLTKNIKIIETPGHSYDSLTMLVKTQKDTIAICGDVYFKKNLPLIDEYASDCKELADSRELLKKLADKVIPGHGNIFKVLK